MDYGVSNDLCRRGGIAQIGGQDLYLDIGLVAQACGDIPQLCRVAGDKTKLHAFTGKFGGYGGADIAAGTCYQRNFFVEFEFNVVSRCNIRRMVPGLPSNRRQGVDGGKFRLACLK